VRNCRRRGPNLKIPRTACPQTGNSAESNYPKNSSSLPPCSFSCFQIRTTQKTSTFLSKSVPTRRSPASWLWRTHEVWKSSIGMESERRLGSILGAMLAVVVSCGGGGLVAWIAMIDRTHITSWRRWHLEDRNALGGDEGVLNVPWALPLSTW
jgi:hypothetical protein